ncbi:unnamed protein product, partial [Allacma fusca]
LQRYLGKCKGVCFSRILPGHICPFLISTLGTAVRVTSEGNDEALFVFCVFTFTFYANGSMVLFVPFNPTFPGIPGILKVLTKVSLEL